MKINFLMWIILLLILYRPHEEGKSPGNEVACYNAGLEWGSSSLDAHPLSISFPQSTFPQCSGQAKGNAGTGTRLCRFTPNVI